MRSIKFVEHKNSITLIVDGDIFRHLTVGDMLPEGEVVASKEHAKSVLLRWLESSIAPVYDGRGRWYYKEKRVQ